MHLCEHIWGVNWVCHFWDSEAFGFRETKYIDLKRPELQRYFFFNFCKQYFKFSSMVSLDNWLPAARGEVFDFFSWVLIIHSRCLFSLEPALTTSRIVLSTPRIISVRRILDSSNALFCSWWGSYSLKFRRIRNFHQIFMEGCGSFSHFWSPQFSCY